MVWFALIEQSQFTDWRSEMEETKEKLEEQEIILRLSKKECTLISLAIKAFILMIDVEEDVYKWIRLDNKISEQYLEQAKENLTYGEL